MVSWHLFFWPIVHPMSYWGIFPFRMRFTDLHRGHVLDDRWFHVICSSDLSCTRCHTRAYFRFGWDLRIFTEVTCLTIDDFMSLFFWPVPHSMPYWRHIFHFRWDLWIFTYVAWSRIDDFMPPDLRPIIHLMPYWGIFPFRLRLTDLHGVACSSPLTRYTLTRCFLRGASQELPS